MKVTAVIPARYNSSRFPGKPLADICGKPMIWWVYTQTKKVKSIDEIIVATDDERIVNVCDANHIPVLLTSVEHDTPTNRLQEVSDEIWSDIYLFIGGDEPLINPSVLEYFVDECKKIPEFYASNAMTTIKNSPEVIDYTNIKVVVNTENNLLYSSRSPLPYPKGELDFVYKKFVGIGAFSKEALDFFANNPKTQIEKIEECDLIRFIEKGKTVRMIDVNVNSLSVDTPKDLITVRKIISKEYGE